MWACVAWLAGESPRRPTSVAPPSAGERQLRPCHLPKQAVDPCLTRANQSDRLVLAPPLERGEDFVDDLLIDLAGNDDSEPIGCEDPLVDPPVERCSQLISP